MYDLFTQIVSTQKNERLNRVVGLLYKDQFEKCARVRSYVYVLREREMKEIEKEREGKAGEKKGLRIGHEAVIIYPSRYHRLLVKRSHQDDVLKRDGM